MKRFRAALLLALGAALVLPSLASAHPLGNFSVNRYSRLEAAGDVLRVHYVLDMGEIPTFQELPAVERDRDAYAARRAAGVAEGLQLTVDGASVPLTPRRQALTLSEGQGGLSTLRLEITLEAPLPNGAAVVEYRDENEPGRLGWREIIAGGPRVEASSVPVEDRTRALREYPENLLSDPLDVRSARLTLAAVAGSGGPSSATETALAASPGVIDRAKNAVTGLVAVPELTPALMLGSLLAAMALGALHALEPGHGKTVVAAYLVGARGTARHAWLLGTTVTVTHTAGVYALGLVTLFASQYILPERLYPVLEIVSGLLVVAIGVWLFGSRLQGALGGRRARAAADHPHHADHPHGHDHPHLHDHPHVHDQPQGHDHPHAHAHGGRVHSHLPLGADGRRVSARGLLLMGISGGLIPCPGALVVLLGAIALHRLAFGLVLILAFSIGLAAVLVGIGLLFVHARGVLARFAPSGGPLTLIPRALPLASAAVIIALGAVLTAQALPRFV